MFKRVLAVLVVLMVLLSFSSVAFAEKPDLAEKQGAQLEFNDGKLARVWLPNETAATAAGNPIHVAGK